MWQLYCIGIFTNSALWVKKQQKKWPKSPYSALMAVGEGEKKKEQGIFFLHATSWKEEKKSTNLFKFVLVLVPASVERVGVSRMRDFLLQSGRASWWRVRYQRGPHRLDSFLKIFLQSGEASQLSVCYQWGPRGQSCRIGTMHFSEGELEV